MRSIITFAGFSACLLGSIAGAAKMPVTVNGKKFNTQDIIARDVVVVGGGSGGTHAAIRLRDQGISVVVIEKSFKLGGHAETYTDPRTRQTVDLGVVIWHNTTYVTDYFKRLDIPLTRSQFFSAAEFDYDLRTGQRINRSYKPTRAESSAAFAAYAQQLAKYPKLNDGIILPDPVPADLYMPFGQFIEKYNFTGALLNMYNFNWGVGDILSNPTLEQMRYWGFNMIGSLGTGFLTTARHNSSEIYTKAESVLASSSSVLLNSQVVFSSRTEGKTGVQLIVRTPKGLKLVLAKKLLVAIPPKLDFVAPLDLSRTEKELFGKYINAGYYVSLVRNSGFPNNTAVSNADQDTPYNFPHLPAVYSISPSGADGVQIVYSGTPQSKDSFPWADDAVKADIIRSIKALQQVNPDTFQQTEPEIIEYYSHAPYFLQVSAEEIKNGFYSKLYALQGQRNTYWTGAAWRVQDSSEIWKYTDTQVLPKLLAGL